MPRPNQGPSPDIADWGRTVKETLSQLGGKPKPKPRVKVKQTLRAGPSTTSYSRHKQMKLRGRPRKLR